MITIEVEIYNFRQELYETFEAIVDTGASFCALPRKISRKLGLVLQEKIHLWQVRDPLVLTKTQIKIRYKKYIHKIGAVIVDIPSKYEREIIEGEECTCPEYGNPLSERIILGENFLGAIPKKEREKILKG